MNAVTALSVSQRAVVALGYNTETEAELKQLAAGSTHITAITNKDGYQQVHSARMALKARRVEIEKLGKGAREDATAFSKAVIAEEKRLIGLIEPEEKRLADLQGAEDARVEAIRQAEIRKEQERVAAIQERIREFSGCVEMALRHPNMTAAQFAEHIADLEKIAVDSTFEEFEEVAGKNKTEAIHRLTDMKTAAEAREAEAARLAVERAALEKQRAEQEAAAKVERERIAAEQAVENARLAKERAEQEAVAKAERDRVAAERAAFEAEQAKARAEQAAAQKKIDDANRELAERQEAERKAVAAREQAAQAELDRKAAAEREAAEKAEKAAQEAAQEAEELRAAAGRPAYVPSYEEIIDAIACRWNVSQEQAQAWIEAAVLAR